MKTEFMNIKSRVIHFMHGFMREEFSDSFNMLKKKV